MAGILRVSQVFGADAAPVKFSPRNMIVFTSSGVWTKPLGCNKVLVKLVGGGGGSCGYGESGGAGGYCEHIIDVINVTSVNVTVGVGGAASVYANASGQGATSSFGTYCSATGGYGANSVASHSGGSGGVGIGGMLNVYGGAGTGHQTTLYQADAEGGRSYWGGGTAENRSATQTYVGVGAPGTGAPGTGSSTGLAGTSGMVVVWEYS